MVSMTTPTTLQWTLLKHDALRLCIAATPRGICYVEAGNQPLATLTEWAYKRFPESSLIEDNARLQPYANQLTEYLRGKRQNFSIPLDLHGTPFQRAVWNVLREIPYGTTRSYADIATRINNRAAVRAVGGAIGANPALILVPCHRVIGKDGSLTGFRGGLDMKTKLLQLEGGNWAPS